MRPTPLIPRSPPPSGPEQPFASQLSDGRWALILFGAVFLAYAPVFHAGIIWDDDAHVTAAGLRSWHGLWLIWSEPGATQQYYPLLHSAFWLEHRLWGDTARGYHLVNLALHGGAALMFALTLRRLAVPGAWLAALLFALHPVNVESVAWISEQKNTLSTVFYLGAGYVYLGFDRTRRRRDYGVATALFVAALLTKTVTATLPAALLVIFWWIRGGLAWRRDVRPLVPWLALGASAGLGTAWVENTLVGAAGAAYDLGFVQRGLVAGRAIAFYLGKFVLPVDLSFVYPRWTVSGAVGGDWLPLAGVLVLATILWRARSRSRAPLAGFLLFAGALFPVLGFFDIYPFVYSYVADHFQYLASLSAAALAAAGALRLGRAGVALLVVALVACGAGTWRQSQMYRDNETLFRTTIGRNPTAWMAYNNLGKELQRDKARLPEAMACFERALQLHPDYFEAENNLGLALAQSGRAREALPHLQTAVRLKSDSYQTFNNLGIAYAGMGRTEEAVEAFRHAAQLNPNLPNLHENLAKALQLLGRPDDAATEFSIAAHLRGAAPGGP